ncbi:MotA/TolQ/ExbB proton channel family protein [uncultured Salinisphaera sp.]|uniref:MotA/TolQ/ExbB proton channel family protein n=1 Tax=uncultured Salinisphaera sp. TaxID=359372 RepID=UPI0032B216CC
MAEMLAAGGWLMLPIAICSVLGLAIVIERAWALRTQRVAPPQLLDQRSRLARASALSNAERQSLEANSPLGHVWAAVVATRGESIDIRRERIEEAGRQVGHDMARYLNTLGTIAAITPLLGLLGTVAGMIQIFATMTEAGLGDAQALAGGIGQALVTTAAGLCVAIPALVAYRYFNGLVEKRGLLLEQWAVCLIEDQRDAPSS